MIVKEDQTLSSFILLTDILFKSAKATAGDVDDKVSQDRTYAFELSGSGDTDYVPKLSAPTNWLTSIEQRIKDSIVPSDIEGVETSPEYLSPFSADRALTFFDSTSGFLPCEPYIYGTEDGDLVAEFDVSDLKLTAIITPENTILFGVSTPDKSTPAHVEIRRGCNNLRGEVRNFLTGLREGSHGALEPR